MTWKVRHEGSPQSTEGLTQEQVMQGLVDGQWEPTDEVMGPGETDWVSLENHPVFADIAAEIEPLPPRVFDDETRLDMNPLIDVCLVLLVFFILTTTYATLQKIIEAANITTDKADNARLVTQEQVESTMVRVSLTLDKSGQVVLTKIEEGKPLEADRDVFVDKDKSSQRDQFTNRLVSELSQFTGAAKRRSLLLDHDAKVPHAFVVALQDAAKTARMDEVLFLVP